VNENDVDSGIALKATDHTDYFGFKNIKICDFRKNFGVFSKRREEKKKLADCRHAACRCELLLNLKRN
jgi:hypothetical protein